MRQSQASPTSLGDRDRADVPGKHVPTAETSAAALLAELYGEANHDGGVREKRLTGSAVGAASGVLVRRTLSAGLSDRPATDSG
jgi:hypothetical protein